MLKRDTRRAVTGLRAKNAWRGCVKYRMYLAVPTRRTMQGRDAEGEEGLHLRDVELHFPGNPFEELEVGIEKTAEKRPTEKNEKCFTVVHFA